MDPVADTPVHSALRYLEGSAVDGYVLCYLGSSRASFEHLAALRSLVHDITSIYQPMMLVGVYFPYVRFLALRQPPLNLLRRRNSFVPKKARRSPRPGTSSSPRSPIPSRRATQP